MFALTRTFCVVIVICSVALLTLNSSVPAPIDNSPIWSSAGATHVLHTDVKHGNHSLRARLAAFGTNVEERRTVALSLSYESNLGCSPEDFSSPSTAPDVTHTFRADNDDQPDDQQPEDWVLLLRGQCSFVDKVRKAQGAGYKGVIVGDDGSSYDSLVTMFAKSTSDVVIPSLFVTHQSYNVLRAASNGSRSMPLEIDASEMKTDWPLLDTLIFICFSPLCTLLVVYIVLFFRRRRLHLDNILPPAYLSKLETVEYMAKDGVNAECVICLETFEEEEKVLELPCKHLYHGDCIRKWLIERKKICPICKRDVRVGIDVREGRIDESAIQSPLNAADAVSVPVLQDNQSLATEETPLLRSTATQTGSEEVVPESMRNDVEAEVSSSRSKLSTTGTNP